MITVRPLFEDFDPHVMHYNRNHSRTNGRFTSGGGGKGMGGGGAAKAGSALRAKKPAGVHSQRVSGTVGGKRRSATVNSRVVSGRRTGTTYTYKVGRGGRVGKAPGGVATAATRGNVSRRFRPGTPIGGNKNLRYISRGHMLSRVGGGSVGGAVGRASSKRIINQTIKNGRPLKPGYVVSYGAPIGS